MSMNDKIRAASFDSILGAYNALVRSAARRPGVAPRWMRRRMDMLEAEMIRRESGR